MIGNLFYQVSLIHAKVSDQWHVIKIKSQGSNIQVADTLGQGFRTRKILNEHAIF